MTSCPSIFERIPKVTKCMSRTCNSVKNKSSVQSGLVFNRKQKYCCTIKFLISCHSSERTAHTCTHICKHATTDTWQHVQTCTINMMTFGRATQTMLIFVFTSFPWQFSMDKSLRTTVFQHFPFPSGCMYWKLHIYIKYTYTYTRKFVLFRFKLSGMLRRVLWNCLTLNRNASRFFETSLTS